MTSIEMQADRWAELWGTDRRRLVDELYTERCEITVLGGGSASGATTAFGREALAALEDAGFQTVPDRRAVPVNVLADGATRGVVELLVVGTSASDITRMAAPALLWWEIEGSTGRIRQEWRVLDWSARRIDDGWRPPAVGSAPDASIEPRSQGWYRDLARRMAETWQWDPLLMVRSLYADDAEVVTLGAGAGGERRGRAALETEEAARLAGWSTEERRMLVNDVIGAGPWMALRARVGATADTEGHLVSVLRLDTNDRIVEEWRYVDWWTAPAQV